MLAKLKASITHVGNAGDIVELREDYFEDLQNRNLIEILDEVKHEEEKEEVQNESNVSDEVINEGEHILNKKFQELRKMCRRNGIQFSLKDSKEKLIEFLTQSK